MEKRGVNDTDEKLCMFLCFLAQAIFCNITRYHEISSSTLRVVVSVLKVLLNLKSTNRATLVLVFWTQRGCSPLHFAVRRRNMASAVHLLGAGCLLDTTDMNGETPLHSAARDGLLPIVQTMCAYGCGVDVVNKVMI